MAIVTDCYLLCKSALGSTGILEYGSKGNFYDRFRHAEMRPERSFPSLSVSCNAFSIRFASTSFTLTATCKNASVSEHSPRAMVYLFALSGYVYRPKPSAIFARMLADDFRI